MSFILHIHFVAPPSNSLFGFTVMCFFPPLFYYYVFFVFSLQVQGMHSDAAALSKASIWHEALRIVNEEGFRAFWKGNLVTIAHRLPYTSVNFYAYEHFKSVSTNIL